MAYDNPTRQSQHMAIGLLEQIRFTYKSAKQAQASLALYVSNANPTFNAAINALHTPVERAELNAMLTQINTLVADWEANHATALGL